MKSFVCLLFLGSLLYSQERYSQVRIPVHSAEEFKRIADLGIAIDHVEGKIGGTISVFLSETELKQLDEANVPYSFIIKDWIQFYAERQRRKIGSLQKFSSTAPKNFRYGAMGGFLTYAEVIQQLDSMKLLFPALITSKDSIGHTHEGRAIYALKISDNPSTTEPSEPEVLYTALHHAREPQGMMTVIYYMWWLLENYTTDPEAKYLVDNRQMWFIPVVNPDGYVFNQTLQPNGGAMWRKNRRDNLNGTFGVDLNRNYGPEFMWNAPNGGSSTSTSSDVYRGSSPFSEPETQAIDAFMRAHVIKTCFNYHTYSNLLIYPWGYKSMESEDSILFRDWSFDMTSVNRYATGTDLQTVAYSTRGNSDDYMFGDTSGAKIRTYALTPEVGATGFWPSIEEIYPLAEENLNANKYLAFVAGEYLSVQTFLNNGVNSGMVIDNKGLSESQPHLFHFQTSDGVVSSSAASGTIPSRSSDTIQFAFVLGNPIPSPTAKIYIKDAVGGAMVNDSVMFLTGSSTIVFHDSANSTSQWSTGTGWSGVDDLLANSKVFTDSPNGKYAANVDNSLTLLSPIDLTSYQFAELQFKTKWSIEPVWDFGVVEISTDGGSVWKPVKTRYSRKGSERFGSKQPAGSFGYDAFSPTSGWIDQRADISEFAGKQIAIRYRLSSDGGEERDGWYLDDIQVIGYSHPPLSVTDKEIPYSFILLQNYPNPFNPVTRINYGIPRSGFVTLYVYDVLGRRIAELVNGYQEAGNHSTYFDASGNSSGIYFYRLSTGSHSSVRTMTVLK
ncbi:MAG: immune inhibitor A [Ignavibacteriales bacterium]|nr:immune inhibitor A [Ignavibacteriales bacterium]